MLAFFCLLSHCLGISYYVNFFAGSYQLNSTANSAHFALFLGKWAKPAVLFSWLFQNGHKEFDFFNCCGCRIFILCEIQCYTYAPQKVDIIIHF